MSNFIQRDRQRRRIFAKLEKKRKQLQCVIKDLSLPVAIRSFSEFRLNKLNRTSSLVRVRNRCVFTGRARGVSQFSRLSRIKFRELVCQGQIIGVSKSSW